MTEEEQSLFDAICDLRDFMEEQIIAAQQGLDHMKGITNKMALYLIYRGKERIPVDPDAALPANPTDL